MTSKKIVCVVDNSIGELDVLLPIFAELRKNSDESYEFLVIFSRRILWSRFRSSAVYLSLFESLSINVQCVEVFPLLDRWPKWFGKVMRWLFFYPLGLISIWNQCCLGSCLIHDYCNHRALFAPLQKLCGLYGIKCFAIPHGMGLALDTAVAFRVRPSRNVVMLVFDSDTEKWHREFGYEHILNIGYVKFYPAWLGLLRDVSSQYFGKDYSVILSRGVHENFMDPDKYVFLLRTAVEILIDTFGVGHTVVIKMHPRESADEIQAILSDFDDRVEISRDHSAVLCVNARVAIGLWTSAIFDAYSVGCPACEFYREAKAFRACEPAGSVFKKIGFKSFDEANSLKAWIEAKSNSREVDPVPLFEQRVTASISSKDVVEVFR